MTDRQVKIGDNTVVREADSGETVIENTAGLPINLQLAPTGRAFLQMNTTTTTIPAADTWTEIEGAWQSAHMNNMSHSDGVLTYDGAISTQIKYVVFVTSETFANNESFEFAVFKDGNLKQRTPVRIDFPRAGEFKTTGIVGFTDDTPTGTTHSVRVRNLGGTQDIEVRDLSFAIQG